MSTPAASAVPASADAPNFSGAPMGSPQVVIRETSGKAITALVLSIIGLIFLLLGIVLGPISICLAVQAKKEIEERPNELGGACQAKAGLIIGIISTVLSVVWIVLIIASVGSASAA
jgi:uncharacterized Tic20 family protein